MNHDGDTGADRAETRLEFLVEPFRENDPGDHVTAAIAAFEARGLDVEMGPFANEVVGERAVVLAAAADALDAAASAGASAVQLRIDFGS